MATLLLLAVLLTAVNSSPDVPTSEGVRPPQERRAPGGCRDNTGNFVRDGRIWQREPCVRCICRLGQIGCLTIKCSPNHQCRTGERLERKPTECCSKCVRMEGTCLHGGTLHENGTTWNPTHSTDMCKCDDGSTTCSRAEETPENGPDPNGILADEPQDSSLTSEAGFLMTVIAGQPDTISTRHLSFNMSTAEDRQIVFIITRKLRAPKEGRLILVGTHHSEVTSFTQKDLLDNGLVYVPPHPEDVASESVFCFPFVVWKYPQRSRLTREHSFCIKVLPKAEGEEMAFRVKDPAFNVTKGGSVEIPRHYLEVERAGRNLKYMVIEAPIHGSLKFLSKRGSSREVTQGFEFKNSDLEENSVFYVHSGMGANKDYVEILATDGWGEAVNKYIINIMPHFYSTTSTTRVPLILSTQPLVILEGEEVRIKSSFLAPTSAVTGRRMQGYYTLSSLPAYGVMILTDAEEGEFPLGVHFAFSSRDVEEGKLLYRAVGEIGLESRTERLVFNFDTGGRDRETSIELEITVLPVDNQAPNVVVNGEVVVAEGSSEQLPPSLLTVTDVDTPIHNLQVAIMTQPYFGRITVNRGGSESVSVQSFSIEEFLKGKVTYEQSYSRRVEPIEDVLLFRVSDGTRSSPLTRLNISIDLQNDEPPKIITNALHVESGQVKLIEKDTLYIEDADTNPGNILISVTQPPTQGVLRKRLFKWRPLGSGQAISNNDTIVYKDILEGLLSYSAIGGMKEKDDFISFTATDGKFHARGKITISITYPEGDINAQHLEWHPTTTVTVPNTERRTEAYTSSGSVRESRSKEERVEVSLSNVASAKVLPARPVVISMAHSWSYHSAGLKGGGHGPGSGRPLVCIPPCHRNHPLFGSTRGICTKVDQNSIRYGWELSVPMDSHHDSYLPFQPLEESTVFANAKANVLDAMYFSKRFRVRCSAELPGGAPVRSEYVTVDGPASCDPRGMPAKGRTFSARLSYVNSSSDDGHADTLKVELSIPHVDGMVPLVSSHPLNDPDLLMTDSMYRAHHSCSNLMPGKGFLSKRGAQSGRWRMYDGMKEGKESVIRIYEYLDLDECTWRFEAWFTVAELVEECGGKMISDLRGNKQGQRKLKFKVPLHISYVVSSSPSEWTATEHKTEMEFSMQYSSLLWKQGIHTEPITSARLQVKRISVDDAGRLVVDFNSFAHFPGRFALRDLESRPRRQSNVLPPNHHRRSMNLTLELLNTDDRDPEGTEQSWRATSDVALEDYTGEYMVRLLPCSFPPQHHGGRSIERGRTPSCSVGSHVEIPMTINFRQIGRPEPITYSLETEFYLAKRPPLLGFGDYDHVKDVQNTEPGEEMYSPGDEIYGLVMWHPSQDLSKAYRLSIQRLYLCSGKEGYVPAYDPTGEIYGRGPQYGCIQPSRDLEHRLLLIDKFGSQSINRDYKGVPFEVHSASEITEFKSILNHSGADGFAMKVDPLYKVKPGNHWYLQVLYSIGPSRTRSKRADIQPPSRQYRDGFLKEIRLKPSTADTENVRTNKGPWMVACYLLLPAITGFVCLKVAAFLDPRVKVFLRRTRLLRTPSSDESEGSEQVEPLNSDAVSEISA